MRILILGGTGMLGHTLWDHLSPIFPNTYTTIRKGRCDYGKDVRLESDRVIEHIDVLDLQLLAGVLRVIQPNVILNCIGITKRREEPQNPIPSIMLNALFPHNLVKLAAELETKVIHFSTDCVFDGTAGNYADESQTNAIDLYGRTKALGEVSGKNAITLRSSFIGYEIGEGTELLEWFLAQKGIVKGFKNAIYTGLTTIELSRVVDRLLRNYPYATGLYNVSSDPISKFDLLKLISNKMHHDAQVIPEETFHCNRSLDSTKFRREFNYTPPSWEKMVEELSRVKGVQNDS
ncbi:MAG TPA: SDR family oxidoreductase [Syntrophales bacterium]|nr:SDR family oxidoreductase [Syntrophales bacterium]